jgi:hypothetical protein
MNAGETLDFLSLLVSISHRVCTCCGESVSLRSIVAGANLVAAGVVVAILVSPRSYSPSSGLQHE